MKKVLSLACIIGLISLSACGGNPPTYDTTIPAQSTNFPTSAIAADSSKNILTDTLNSGTAFTGQVPPLNVVQPNSAKSIGTLNPEHGKPGHRCDIAVGAPLNSPQQPVQQTAMPTQKLPALPNPASNASGIARLNPAHGQPGHDCAVQVGQPLKN